MIDITVIIPCRNEEKYIATVIEDVLNQNYDHSKLELLIIDGISNDGTRALVEQYMQKYPIIQLFDNPNKTVPYAMNLGIRNSNGLKILRLDAHASYPQNYISILDEWMDKLNADNIGGLVETVPADSSLVAKSIARALSHPFGVGNAYFRIGIDKPKEVDTVMFGFYRRSVFEKTGLFDESLTRNQDDELNARLKRNGGRIFLIPYTSFKYFPRESLRKLWQMYYQYGYFKPLVNRKIGIPSNWRQLIPPLLVISILFSMLFGILLTPFRGVALLILILYLTVNLAVSWQLVKNEIDFKNIIYQMTSFSILHFSYGLGYLKGLLDFYILRRAMKSENKTIALTR